MTSASTAPPHRLVAPDPLRPVGGSPVSGSDAPFAWTAVPDADCYELEAAVEADFADPGVQFTVEDRTAITDAFPDDGSTWYWRVRAHAAAGPGPWSGVAHFTAVPDAAAHAARPAADAGPSGPQPVTPVSGAPVDGQSAVFEWTLDETASAFRLQVARAPAFDAPAVDVAVDPTTTLTLYGLLPDDESTFYWRIQAERADAPPSPWSDPARLTAATDEAVVSHQAEQEARRAKAREQKEALAKRTAAATAEAESPALHGQTPAWMSIAMAYVMVLSFLATLFLITRAL